MNGGHNSNQQPKGPRGGGMMMPGAGSIGINQMQANRAGNQNVNMMMMQAKK